MKDKTKKLILLIGLAVMLATLGFVAYVIIGPEEATAPINPETQPSPESLVTFPDDESKQKFLEDNNLTESDLAPSGQDQGTYVVPKSQEELKTDDATVAPRREYKALLAPNDTIYPQWYTTVVDAPQAWDITTGSSSVTVAVIDGGFGLSHEDMSGRWAANVGEVGSGKETNGQDDDGNGFIDDWQGWDFAQGDNNPSAGSTNVNGNGVTHGTHVSGLVGATGNNGVGVASLAWGVKILPLQALTDDGNGYTEDIVAAINYAVDQDVQIINMSLGTTGIDPTLKTAIDNAVSSGVTVIAAAGNCGNPNTYLINGCSSLGQVLYPAKYSDVIAVAASDQNDNRASFSSYGPEVDLMAPGSGTIRTTDWSSGNQTTSYTAVVNGTSIASPVVAGAAALMYSQFPTITPSQVNAALTLTAEKTAEMGAQTRTDEHGYGRMNVQNALTADQLPCPNTVLPGGNVGGAGTGERLLPTALGNGNQILSLILQNNTSTGCIESHGWPATSNYWISHTPTNRFSADPADAEVITGDVDGDGRDENYLVEYRSTSSGKIQIHGWTYGLQGWFLHAVTSYNEIDPATARVITADIDGNGKDEFLLINYTGTASGAVEVHGWNFGFQNWFLHSATAHSTISTSDARVFAGDRDGDGKDEIYLAKYTNTGSGTVEVHGFSSDFKGWFLHAPTNHSSISNSDAEVIAADITGGPADEFLLAKYLNTGTGRVEIHGWTTNFQSWFLHNVIP